jgi:hypothetical protein
VDLDTDRYVFERQTVTYLDFGGLGRNNSVADFEVLGGEDVVLDTVSVD